MLVFLVIINVTTYHMKKSLYLIPVVLVAFITLGAGCAKNTTSTQETVNTVSQNTATTAPEKGADDDHAHDAEHGAKLAGTRIALQNATNLQPGEVTLAFKLYGSDAHEFGPKDLKLAHEKLMHVILVRDDVTGFQHIHPEYRDGRWSVVTTIATQGLYQMYVDIEPIEEDMVTLRVPLLIGGSTAQPQFARVSTNMSAQVSGFEATLQLSSPLKTKEHTNLTFLVTQNGKPVTQIDPYLGAFGHVVVIRHNDADDYLHGHPITETKPTDGKIVFESEFPIKGVYTIFAQFNINGQVKVFPITVSVENIGKASAEHESSSSAVKHGGSSPTISN